MRVTEEIKEIIKRKIDSILTPKIEAKLRELKNLHNERNKIKNIYSAEFDEIFISAIKSAIKTFKKRHPSNKTASGIEIAYHYSDCYSSRPPIVIKDIDEVAKKMSTNTWDFIQPYLTETVKLETELARLKELRESIPNDIILELALGATKADFERILNKHLAFSQKL